MIKNIIQHEAKGFKRLKWIQTINPVQAREQKIYFRKDLKLPKSLAVW